MSKDAFNWPAFVAETLGKPQLPPGPVITTPEMLERWDALLSLPDRTADTVPVVGALGRPLDLRVVCDVLPPPAMTEEQLALAGLVLTASINGWDDRHPEYRELVVRAEAAGIEMVD